MTTISSSAQLARDLVALESSGISTFQPGNTSRCKLECPMCDRQIRGADADDEVLDAVLNRLGRGFDGGRNGV